MFLSILVLVVTWDSGPSACGRSYQTRTLVLLPAVEGTPRPVDLHQRHRLCRVAAIWRQENRRHPTTVGETQSKIFVVGIHLCGNFIQFSEKMFVCTIRTIPEPSQIHKLCTIHLMNSETIRIVKGKMTDRSVSWVSWSVKSWEIKKKLRKFLK